MPAIRPEKTATIAEVTEKFKNAPITIIIGCKGLTVEKTNTLRSRLRKSNTQMRVVKNTLARIAARKLNYNLDAYLSGPTSLVFSTQDAVEPAKVLVDFIKAEEDRVSIKAALMDGKVLSTADVKALSKLPSREELIAQLVGSIKAPITRFVLQMGVPLRKLVYVLDAIKTQKETKA